jgi:hypothetical protein
LFALALLTAWEARLQPAFTAAPLQSRATFAALAFAAAGALGAWVARTTGTRAAIYTLAVLGTTPAWFLRARADASAFPLPALCFAGVALAVLDPGLGRRPRAAALVGAALAAWWALRVCGLAVACGVPCLAVGLARLTVSRDEDPARPPRLAVFLTIGGGVILTLAAATATFTPDAGLTAILAGPRSGSHAPSSVPLTVAAITFGARVSRAAYALVPWTPLVPFALLHARRSLSPTALRAHAALVCAAVFTFVLETALPARDLAGPLSGGAATFASPALSALIGTLLADLDGARHPSPSMAPGLACLGVLVAHDLALAPERGLDALVLGLSTGYAQASVAELARALRGVLVGVTAISAAALLAMPIWLRRCGARRGRGRLPRGAIIAGSGLIGGVVLRAAAYPALIDHISPHHVLQVWADHKEPGDKLGVFGVDEHRWPGPPAVSAGTQTVELRNAEGAASWLTEALPSDEERRFLALGPTALPRVNALFRAKRGANLPILSAGGAFLLGASALGPREESENPLDPIVRSSPPDDLRPIGDRTSDVTEVRIGDALVLVGWRIKDTTGHPISALARRSAEHAEIVLRVETGGKEARLSDGFCTFLHLDHTPTRYSVEHRSHPYPMSLWRDRDVLVDDFEIALPPQFGAGTYPIYWGVGVLPCQDDRRLPVTSGPSDGHDRLRLGRVEVR